MVDLIGTSGQTLNPKPPAGFYMAGTCPVCGSPLFYHGKGSGTTTEKDSNISHIHTLDAAVFKICECEFPDTPLQVPKNYDFLQERGSIDYLFTLIKNAVDTFRGLEAQNQGLLEQIQEFLDERALYLPYIEQETVHDEQESGLESEPDA